MSGFVISGDNEKKIRGTLVFMQITAVYVALVSVFGAYFSVFETGIEFRTMCLRALVIVGAVHVLLFRTEHLGRRTFVIVLLTGCLAAVWKETLFKGIVPFVNAYIEQRNQFYSIEQPGMAQEPDILGCFAVAAIIQLLLGLILTVILRSGRGGILALLVMLLPVILAATVGHMPSYTASWELLAAGVLYLMMYRRKTEGLKIQEIAAAAVVLAIFYGLGYVSAPLITAYKEEHRKEYDEIQEKIIDSQQVDVREMIENQLERSGDYLEGGIGEGDLRNLSGYHPQGVVEMEVAVDELPKSTVYLKAFVGTTYTGSKWKELKTSEFSDVISPIFGGTKRRELMNEPFDRIEKGNNNLTKQQMTITIKNASAGYGCLLYTSDAADE